MYRDQMNGQMKRLRGMLTQSYGLMVGDAATVHRGMALRTAGQVEISCARALAHVATALRGFERNVAH